MNTPTKITVTAKTHAGGLPPPASGRVFYRQLHKIEGGYQSTPPSMPEVLPPINAPLLKMTEAIQRMSFELMTEFNPLITPDLWTKVYRHDKAFTNFNGFEDPDDPRWNYIKNTDADKPLPAYDKDQRLCGGAWVSGVEGMQTVAGIETPVLLCRPDVDGIDANRPLPTIAEIIKNEWYFFAVSVNKDFTVIVDFPQGKGGVVAIPYIIKSTCAYNLSYFERWTSSIRPDHLRIYNKG